MGKVWMLGFSLEEGGHTKFEMIAWSPFSGCPKQGCIYIKSRNKARFFSINRLLNMLFLFHMILLGARECPLIKDKTWWVTECYFLYFTPILLHFFLWITLPWNYGHIRLQLLLKSSLIKLWLIKPFRRNLGQHMPCSVTQEGLFP